MQHAFLDAVLPAEGTRVVAHVPRGWSAFRHEFVDNNDQLVQRTSMLDDDHLPTYFALASFAPDAAERTIPNTRQLKCFWIDLDFKEYKTTTAARADIIQLSNRVGEPSFIVHSGGGLHLYWVFNEPLDTAVWHPLALAFQATWQAEGMKADPVSTDASRVLRMPGTHNRKEKYGEPRPVRIILNTNKTYDPWVMAESFVEVTVEGHILPLIKDLAVPDNLRRSHDDLIDGLGHRESHFGPLLDRCLQVRHAWDDPDDLLEPVWHAIVQLVRHTVDGDMHAHAISEGHHSYSERETDKKLAYLEAKDVGPTTCDRFRALNPAGCVGCPHRITSPIVLGHVDAEVMARAVHSSVALASPAGAHDDETPPPSLAYEPRVDDAVEPVVHAPAPTRAPARAGVAHINPLSRIPADSQFDFNAQTKYIEMRKRGGDGEYTTVSIFHGFLCPERVEYDAGLREATLLVYVQNAGQAPKHIRIPMRAMADKKSLSIGLLNEGVQVMTKNAGDILELLQVMSNDLVIRQANTNVIDQMGWQDDGGFVVGTTGYTPTGEVTHDVPAVQPILNTAPHFTQSGTLDGWKKTAEAYNRPGGEVYQFALCYGAAGLLLPDTTYSGVVLSLYSRESGRGKTTVGFGALSWWGNPDMLKSQASDTNNALFNKASRSKNLPIVIDEITEKPARDLSDVIYHMAQGREKESLTSNRDPRQVLPPWTLPVITTSNVAVKPLLHDHRGDSQGMFARIFEVSLSGSFAPSATALDKDILRDGFTKNYGVAGPVLAAHIMANHDRLNIELRKIIAMLDSAVQGDPYYRFWVASCAAALTVAIAANECGLLSYNVEALSVWAVDSMKAQRDSSDALIPTPDEVLSRFLALNVNNIMLKMYRRTSVGAAGVRDFMYWPEDGVRGNRLVGLADFTSGRLLLSHHAVTKFCRDAGHDVDGFALDSYELVDAKGGRLLLSTRPYLTNLGEGSRTASARTRALGFNLRHEALADYARQYDEVIRASSEGGNIRSIK